MFKTIARVRCIYEIDKSETVLSELPLLRGIVDNFGTVVFLKT